jgi:AbrB family looped-hinge helix DNA binding protein
MIKTIKVSQKGQIAIPQEIRESMKIAQGDELILIQAGDKLLIEKSCNVEKMFSDDMKDILKFNQFALKEIWDNKEDDIWASYLKKKNVKLLKLDVKKPKK